VINKFYLLCVIFSGSPDLTLKTCLVFLWHIRFPQQYNLWFRSSGGLPCNFLVSLPI